MSIWRKQLEIQIANKQTNSMLDFPKTSYFSSRATVGIVEREKSRFLPQINRTGNCSKDQSTIHTTYNILFRPRIGVRIVLYQLLTTRILSLFTLTKIAFHHATFEKVARYAHP